MLPLWQYIQLFWGSWLSFMSGLASVVLAFLAVFSPASDNGKRYLFGAASACFVIASFRVWLHEHREKLKLEEESGPDVFVEIIPRGISNESVQFMNIRKEAALNVQLDENENDALKLGLARWIIPVLEFDKPQLSSIMFCEVPGVPNIQMVKDCFKTDQERGVLRVIFQDSKGTKFRRYFELHRPLLSSKVECYPKGAREVIR